MREDVSIKVVQLKHKINIKCNVLMQSNIINIKGILKSNEIKMLISYNRVIP